MPTNNRLYAWNAVENRGLELLCQMGCAPRSKPNDAV